jgi:SAM-dependent methyltransferase
MGFYRDNVVPRLVNWTCATSGLDRWRVMACQGLRGETVEVGFGSGLNVAHYPDPVTIVYAVEPSSLATKLSAKRVRGSRIPIELIGLDGQSLALADQSCDSALCTFSLCTIPDGVKALSEIFRVLRPGGQLHFLEHGRAPDATTLRWQTRLEPWQMRFADGCHLTRDPIELVTGAGFEMVRLDQRFAHGPRPWCYFSCGSARRPVTPIKD